MIPQNPSLVHLIIVLMEKQGSNVIAADYEVSRERKQAHLWRTYTMHDVYTCNSWRLRVVSRSAVWATMENKVGDKTG